MMYSLGRQVFPVDTHVGRVLSRLGPYRELGLSLDRARSQEAPGRAGRPRAAEPPVLAPRQPGRAWPRGLPSRAAALRAVRDPELLRDVPATRGGAGRIASPRPPPSTSSAGPAGSPRDSAGPGSGAGGPGQRPCVDPDILAEPSRGAGRRVVSRDITTLRRGELRRLAGRKRVDVLLGAPPCQGFSHVGLPVEAGHDRLPARRTIGGTSSGRRWCRPRWSSARGWSSWRTSRA